MMPFITSYALKFRKFYFLVFNGLVYKFARETIQVITLSLMTSKLFPCFLRKLSLRNLSYFFVWCDAFLRTKRVIENKYRISSLTSFTLFVNRVVHKCLW